MKGAKIKGAALSQGGSDLETPPELLVFSIQPVKGNAVDLKAEHYSDALKWLNILSSAAKGERPKVGDAQRPQVSADIPAVTEASTEVSLGANMGTDSVVVLASTINYSSKQVTSPDSSASAAMVGPGEWVELVNELGQHYYWQEATGATQWEPPPGFARGWVELVNELGERYY